MDIWDSLRLVWRHWRFTVPVAVCGVLFSLILSTTASTTWSVQTIVVLLGPSEIEIGDEGISRAENPYFEAGQAMPLTRVLAIALRDPDVLRGLEDEGLSSNYSMEWDNRQPLLTTQVIADSPDIADATASRLLELMDDELETRQVDVEAPASLRAGRSLLARSVPSEDFRNPRLLAGVGAAMTIAATAAAAFAIEWWRRRGEYGGGSEDWEESEYLPPLRGNVRVVREVPSLENEGLPTRAESRAESLAERRAESRDEPREADYPDSGSRWGRREAT